MVLWILVWIFSSEKIFSQHLGYKKYTVDDGLVQSEVLQSFQDSRGYIWLGTKFGISRFDGNKFVTHFDSLAVLKSTIRYIHEIKTGSVIAGSFAGYAVFSPDGSLTSFRFPIFPSGCHISSWTADGKMYISFICGHQIHILEATQNGPVDVTASFEGISQLVKNNEVVELIYDKKNHCFYFTDSNQEVFSFSNNGISRLNLLHYFGHCLGKDGNVYIISGLDRKVSLAPKRASYFHTVTLISPGFEHQITQLNGRNCSQVLHFQSLMPASLAHFEVSETGKIAIPDPTGKRILFSEKGKLSIVKLGFDGIESTLLDDESTLWIGTASGLIHVFPDFFINFTGEEGLSPNTQTLITDPTGKVWAGSYEAGLQYFEKGRFVSKEIPGFPDPNSALNFYPGGGIDHAGVVHFCVRPFFELTLNTNKLEFNSKWPYTPTLFFYDDTATKSYFFGSGIGLVEQKYDRYEFIVHPVFNGSHNSGRIASIVRAGNGKLILGGFKSVLLFDGKTYEKYPNSSDPDIPGANAMAKDHKGNVWIGNSNGIYLYNGKRFSKVPNGHFNDLVLSLYCIDYQWLLIGGIRGIGLLDLEKYYKSGVASIRYFDKNNGFVGGECQQNCITRDGDGFFWIGVSNGIVRFDASGVASKIPSPRVYITQVFTNDGTMEWEPLSISEFRSNEKKLLPPVNSIKFEFTGISLTAPENVKFRYKLEGFDKNWSVDVSDRSVTYTNLPPGRYIFKVRAYSDTGAESIRVAEFSLYVVERFWTRWYIRLFFFVVLSAVIIIGVSHILSRRNRILRQKLEDERRYAELQFKTLRNQLDPHFVFNALNAIGSSIYQNDKEKSYDFLQRFATLIRSTLLHADRSYRKLSEEIEFVKNYLELERFRFENKFDYLIHLPESINPEIQVPKMIIQTFAENSLKHGLVQRSAKGLLTVSVDYVDENLVIVIKDNGIGRKESLKYNSGSTGKGLEIFEEFIALFNKFNEKKIHFEITDILTDSGQIAGTCVTIILPVDFTYNSINLIQ